MELPFEPAVRAIHASPILEKTMSSDQEKHPEQDPVEGSRRVVDHELKRQEGKNGKRTADADKAAAKVQENPGRD